MINRDHALAVFRDYTARYDITNERIRLKAEHTYCVAANCDAISDSLGLTGQEKELAWLIGLLHDYGRFEQVRLYDTFYDKASVDHAELGADLLFGRGEIFSFLPPDFPEQELRLIETAIRQHNKYRVTPGLDPRTQLFCDIIRDADKLDIFRVINESSVESVYSVSEEHIRTCPVSDYAVQCVREHSCLDREKRSGPADAVVSHITLVFELVYPASRSIAVRDGHICRLLDFRSDNPEAAAKFAEVRGIVTAWLGSLGAEESVNSEVQP